MHQNADIFIKVQAAEAYDRLSILDVKINNIFIGSFDQRKALSQQKKDLQTQINTCIGYDLASKIYNSDEYKALYKANLDVFNAVDISKKDLILASEVDKLNYERFVQKNKLQEKFFSESFKEIKVGYEK